MKHKKLLIGLLSALCVATSGVALAGCSSFEQTLGVPTDKRTSSRKDSSLSGLNSSSGSNTEDKTPSEVLGYTLSEDGISYVVTGYTGVSANVIIPATYEGKSVTSIGDYAFYNCDSLTSIEIPDSVTMIGEYAFAYCDSITSITVDKNNMTYQSLDGNLYSIDGKTLIQYAVGKTATSFTIPDSVTSIVEGAFNGCTSLRSIEIPESVTSIGNHAFLDCTSIKSIIVDKNNMTYQSLDGNLYSIDGKTLIQYAVGKTATSFTIPDSVTSIGEYVFSNCSLTSVVIGDSVTSIGRGAFFRCASLNNINYKGTAEEWKNISISYDNDDLTSATRYYYSESKPTVSGNFWRYDANDKIIVWITV